MDSSMLLHVSTISVALFVLVKSADLLVEHSTSLARRFEISDLVVGLVLTSVGTSLPELASSLSAALANSSGIVIGNVVGSNIANIGLVLGVAAVIGPFETLRRMHDRDGYVLMASAIGLFTLALDNQIGRLDAVLFLLVYVAYVVFAARSDRDGIESRFRDFLKFFFDFEYAAPLTHRFTRRPRSDREAPTRERPAGQRAALARELIWVAASLGALILSARFAVSEAVWLAGVLQLPENLVGLSLIAIGTSLPELLVSVTAARKGRAELIVGNVLGSNIANTLLVLGLCGVVRPIAVAELSVVYTIPFMLFFSLALLYFLRSDWRVSRLQGAILVAAYVAFLTTAFVRGWG